MKYLNKDEYFYKIGDIVTADGDYQVSIPSAFYMTISELLFEDCNDLCDELQEVYNKYNEMDNDTSLGYDEIYVITKDIKITYEY